MAVPISARRDGSNIMHCTGPDVCKTPMGGAMVPVPYMSMVTLGSSVRTSKTVRNNGKQDYQLNSRALTVTGHEPGIGKGVKVPGYKAYAHAMRGSKTVFSEGWSVVRNNDPAWINHPTVGPTEPFRSIGKGKVPILMAGSGGTPGSNKAQNKQFRDIVKLLDLNKSQARMLHDAISGQNLGFQEILDIGTDMFGGK